MRAALFVVPVLLALVGVGIAVWRSLRRRIPARSDAQDYPSERGIY